MNPTITLILSKIGDILLALLGTDVVKRIVVSKLLELTKHTDNTLDDAVVGLVDSALHNTKDVTALKTIYESWTGKKLVEETPKE